MLHNIPKELRSHLHCCQSLKSLKVVNVITDLALQRKMVTADFSSQSRAAYTTVVP